MTLLIGLQMKFTPTHIHTQARDSMPKKKQDFFSLYIYFFDILIFNVTTNMAKRYIQVIFMKNIKVECYSMRSLKGSNTTMC